MKKNNWIKNNLSDIYIKKAKLNELRSRSWFKIYEIDKKFNLFKKGINVIDIGSSPGGWSKYVSDILNNTGKIFSCDILLMKPINNVFFLKGDISNRNFYYEFIKLINKNDINVVISDISPNISGFSYIDLPKLIYLANISLKICLNFIKHNGSFLLKLFHGNDTNIFLKKIYSLFKEINIFKPNSSRNKSSEFYVIAKKLNLNNF